MRFRRAAPPTNLREEAYSPECVEGAFSELRAEGVLRSSNGHDLKITRLRYVPSRGKRYAAVRTDDAEEDRMDTDLKAYKLDPLQGEALWFIGNLATVKVSAEQTGGGYVITEQMFPGGRRRRFTPSRTTRRSTSSKGTSRSTSKTANPSRPGPSCTSPPEPRTPTKSTPRPRG